MLRLLYCIFLKMEYGTFTRHQMIAYNSPCFIKNTARELTNRLINEGDRVSTLIRALIK